MGLAAAIKGRWSGAGGTTDACDIPTVIKAGVASVIVMTGNLLDFAINFSESNW
jgi:hypothetical protein